jgi:hypothetical protein
MVETIGGVSDGGEIADLQDAVIYAATPLQCGVWTLGVL